MDMKKYLADLEKLVNIDCGSNVPGSTRSYRIFQERA